MNNIELNVVIPMAGIGSRFKTYGFTENKYLLPINNSLTKMIEKAILTLNIHCKAAFIFILLEETGINNDLRDFLQTLCKNNNYVCHILSVNSLTEGPASSVYIAKDILNNDIPLIVSNSDQILDWNFEKFYSECNKYDGCVLTYKPNYKLILGEKDKHSFVRFENCKPVEFVEKTVISEEALVGVHYYKKGKYFIQAYEYLFENNIRAPNNEFYLSYTYQALLDLGNFSIGTSMLNDKTEHFYPVGEPEDYFNYYNNYSKILIYKLSDFELINNKIDKDFFKLDYIKKEDILHPNNELVIKLNNDCNDIFLTGENYKLNFNEDSYILRVFNINKLFNHINISDYLRGWIIGNFEPSIKRETRFEIGLLSHFKMEKWAFHYHKESIEINILIEGKMIINNIEINKGNIFIFNKNIIACPIFLEDCKILCIKIPSIPGDKYII
jgi:NDP-sugar pyrophosphorylase family protein